jgi:hypothetical protein
VTVMSKSSSSASSIYAKRPERFLEIRVHLTGAQPASTRGLCTGYERGGWNNNGLADYMFEYLPDFALRYEELGPVGHEMWVPKLVEAARSVYTTDKFKRRGEFGELLLHAVLREIWETEPAVSKIYYKDGPNVTVKGFDSVHVALAPGHSLELLLGEVKFYKAINRALTDVAKELRAHFENDEWLRSEFIAVTRKIDSTWPHTVELKKLLHRRRTLASIIKRVRVPVLLTYESSCVEMHDDCHEQYCADLTAEITEIQEQFAGRALPTDVVIDLLLVPMHRKADLLGALEKRLRAWRLLA